MLVKKLEIYFCGRFFIPDLLVIVYETYSQIAALVLSTFKKVR